MRFIFILGLGLQWNVMAAPDGLSKRVHALMTPEEQEFNRRARQKLYPGGKDEEPLKVQSQLQPITRKMGPSSEAPADEPSEDAASSEF
jgi:hypothetical protein